MVERIKETIKEIILKSIIELNEDLEEDERLEVSEKTILFGEESRLDSLDFVNLVVTIEENIFNETGKSITIANEKAFSKKYNPFKDVERLAEFIQELLEEEE